MASISAKITLDATHFHKALDGVRKSASALGSSIATALRTTATAAAAVAAAVSVAGGALAVGVKDALNFGASLKELSDRTGAPVKDLIVLRQAFADVGIDAEKVGGLINKMQKALSGVNEEGKPTAEAFNAIGLKLEDVRKLSVTDQFAAISKAIGAIKDPADRAAAAMDLFGKTGGELNQLFQNPDAIAHASKVLGGQADILAKNAAAFERVSIALKNVSTKVRGFFVGVADSILGKLSALANVLDSIDLSGFGKKVGDAISSSINILVNAIKEGKLGELFGLTLKAGFATAGDFLIGAIQVVVAELRDGIALAFHLLTDSEFYGAIVLAFNGVFLKVTAFLAQALKEPIAFGAALLSVAFQKAIQLFYGLKSIFASVAAFFVAAITTGVQKIIALLPKHLQPAGFKKQTFDENLAEKKKEFHQNDVEFKPQSFADALKEQQSQYQPEFIKNINGLADEALKGATAKFGEIVGKIKDLTVKNVEGFKMGDVFDSSGIRQQLEALAKSLNKPVGEVVAAAGKAALGDKTAGQAKTDKGVHGRNIEADSFAKIGLFARASNTNVVDHARRTAENTGKMVSLLSKIAGTKQPAAMAVAG